MGLIYGPRAAANRRWSKRGCCPGWLGTCLPVYVEATSDETEARLLNGLRKRCPDLPADLDLKETLAALRQGQGIARGTKVLIVLDQFEQWLHAKQDEENTELVQALRQCDGGRVQCIVMVRDDFWLAVSRFMPDLEVDLVPGRNSPSLIFSILTTPAKYWGPLGEHSASFPRKTEENTKEQQRVLEAGDSGLAENSKVICVRLALFAEMMKGKPWTPAALKAVGGTEGIGVTFLEEPSARHCQSAAPSASESRWCGAQVAAARIRHRHQRQHAVRQELMEASGYGDRPTDFEALIRILDSEVRLITPTDPKGVDTEYLQHKSRDQSEILPTDPRLSRTIAEGLAIQ